MFGDAFYLLFFIKEVGPRTMESSTRRLISARRRFSWWQRGLGLGLGSSIAV